MVLTVTDTEGRVVRGLVGPVTAGTHRVAWDLRYPQPDPPRARPDTAATAEDDFAGLPRGPHVAPGMYRVSLAKRVDGVLTPLGEPRSFEVYPLDGPGARPPGVLAFQQQVWVLMRAVLGANAAATETMKQIQLLERAMQETPGLDDRLVSEVRALEVSLREIQEALNGDPTRERRQESSPPSLLDRLRAAGGSSWSGTLGDVSDTHKRQYEIVASEFGVVVERLRRLVELDLRRVEQTAEAQGVPWTSGRMPRWPPAGR